MHYLIFMSQLRSCNGFKCVYNVKISSSLNFGHAGQNIQAQHVKLHAFARLILNKKISAYAVDREKKHTAVLVLLQEIPKRRKLLLKNDSFEFCLPSTVGEKVMPSLS